MTMHRPFAFFAAIFCASTFAAAADQTYAVKMNRPFKAGDAYEMHAILDNHNTIVTSLPGHDPDKREQSLNSELTGRIDIASVDAQGNEKDFTIAVKKFTIGEGKRDAVDPGKVIEVKRTEKAAIYTIKGGGEIPEEARQALSQLFEKLNPSGVTDDDVFGSNGPHKVGDSWPINSEMAAKQAGGSGIKTDPKNLTGQTTLKAVENSGGGGAGAAIRLVTNITMTDAMPGDLPPNVIASSSELKGQVNALYPVDATLPPREVDTTIDTHAVILGVTQPLRIENSGHQHEALTITIIKK